MKETSLCTRHLWQQIILKILINLMYAASVSRDVAFISTTDPLHKCYFLLTTAIFVLCLSISPPLSNIWLLLLNISISLPNSLMIFSQIIFTAPSTISFYGCKWKRGVCVFFIIKKPVAHLIDHQPHNFVVMTQNVSINFLIFLSPAGLLNLQNSKHSLAFKTAVMKQCHTTWALLFWELQNASSQVIFKKSPTQIVKGKLFHFYRSRESDQLL